VLRANWLNPQVFASQGFALLRANRPGLGVSAGLRPLLAGLQPWLADSSRVVFQEHH
jgi:hypothetical protein